MIQANSGDHRGLRVSITLVESSSPPMPTSRRRQFRNCGTENISFASAVISSNSVGGSFIASAKGADLIGQHLKIGIGDRRAVDLHPFVEAQNVRRGIQPRCVSARPRTEAIMAPWSPCRLCRDVDELQRFFRIIPAPPAAPCSGQPRLAPLPFNVMDVP